MPYSNATHTTTLLMVQEEMRMARKEIIGREQASMLPDFGNPSLLLLACTTKILG